MNEQDVEELVRGWDERGFPDGTAFECCCGKRLQDIKRERSWLIQREKLCIGWVRGPLG